MYVFVLGGVGVARVVGEWGGLAGVCGQGMRGGTTPASKIIRPARVALWRSSQQRPSPLISANPSKIAKDYLLTALVKSGPALGSPSWLGVT